MIVKVNFKNRRKVTELLKSGVRRDVNRAVFRVIAEAQKDMQENVTKDIYSRKGPGSPFKRTGKLRQSIVAQMLMFASGKVFVGAKYGEYVEEGTGIFRGRQPYWTTFGGILSHPILYKGVMPRPFFKPVVDYYRPRAGEMINTEAFKELNGLIT